MAEVRLADVIVPELFNPYDSLSFLSKDVYYNSGVAFSDPRVTRLMNASEGGNTIVLPFWNPVDDSEAKIASDDPETKITADKITAGAEVAAKGYYTKAWSSMELTGALAGSDPMGVIADQVDRYWINQIDKRVLNASIGIVGDSVTNHNSDLVLDVTGEATANLVDGDVIIDARGTLGDIQENVGVIAMHSVVYTQLQKQQLIQYVRDADNNTMFATFNGMRVIYTDNMPTVSAGEGKTAYYTFIYGPNVFSLNMGAVDNPQAVDYDNAAGNGFGKETLYSRRCILVHPRGYKVDDALLTNVKSGLTFAECAKGATWTRVYDNRKRIPFVAIKSLG